MPAGMKLLNSNDRAAHWGSGRNDPVQALRGDARRLAMHMKIAPLMRARIICYVCLPDGREFDPGNFYPSAKPCVDGLVDAGVLLDDARRYVTGPDMRAGYPNPLPRLELVITELPPEVTLTCRSLKAARELTEFARTLRRAGDDDYVKAVRATVVITTQHPEWADAIRNQAALAGLLADTQPDRPPEAPARRPPRPGPATRRRAPRSPAGYRRGRPR
jgi:hypothetical protein